MEDLPYEEMSAQQAVDALDEFLAERPAGLERLRSALDDAGAGSEDLLDGTVGSVAPLWDWITARVTELGTDPRTLDEDPTRPSWAGWVRHVELADPHPPAGSFALLDGFVSYLALLITTAVPEASWQVGDHLIADHPMHHYPVLGTEHHLVFLPAVPGYSVYQSANGRTPMDGTDMRTHVVRTIDALRGRNPGGSFGGEPLVTVVAEVDCFDVGLREDIASGYPDMVEQMIGELCGRDGVEAVHRYGPAALVVDAPHWNDRRLKLWCTTWLQCHLLR